MVKGKGSGYFPNALYTDVITANGVLEVSFNEGNTFEFWIVLSTV